MSLPLRICRERGCSLVRTAKRSVSSVPFFKTLENDPTKHTTDHIGKFYTIAPETCNTTFNHGGFPKSFQTNCKTFTETCLMIRQPALDIIDYIKKSDMSKPVNRYCIYGELGNGKTLTMTHVVHYASLSNFITVQVPWVTNWLRHINLFKEMVNSPTREGLVDLPMDAAAWLVHFKLQNYNLLKTLDLRIANKYEWSKREVSEVDSSLLDLVEFGISRMKYACEVTIALTAELKAMANQKKCKILVAIDGYNCLFYPLTRVKTDTRKKNTIPPQDISLSIPFMEFTKNDWSNGAVLVIVDRHAVATDLQESNYPHYLLGKEGFEHLDPFVPIEVGPYTDKEYASVVGYYRDRLWFRGSTDLEEELAFTSGKNPYRFMDMCAGL